MTLVATQVKRRRGTGAENDAFTGAEGEITVDLTNKELRVHTGDNKVGGYGLARKDFENITDRARNISNWSSNVSNGIISIPQDIKLELNNGTLTLKAGSKVYIPNGSGVFDTVTITADVSTTRTDNQDCIVWRYPNGNLGIFPKALFYSGATAPTQYQFMFWYDTTNNLCKYTTNSGSTWTAGASFPICLISTDGTKISAIKQIFNGFGYVGRSIFSLPAIRVLRPTGRNDNGTLKNSIGSVGTVVVRTFDTTDNFDKAVIGWWGGFTRFDYTSWNYDETENRNYISGTIWDSAVVGTVKLTNGVISEFNIKTPFHAVDYNDTGFIAHQAMPSARRISLTATNEGAYTAPADGYFAFFATANASNGYAGLRRAGLVVSMFSSLVNTTNGAIEIPVRKGEVITLFYGNVGSVTFYFEYAQGATNE